MSYTLVPLYFYILQAWFVSKQIFCTDNKVFSHVNFTGPPQDRERERERNTLVFSDLQLD